VILAALAIVIGRFQPLTSILFLTAALALGLQVALALLELRRNWGFHVYAFKRLVKEKLKLGQPTPISRKTPAPDPEFEDRRRAFMEKMDRIDAELEQKKEKERIERREREGQEKLELRKRLELKTAAEALKEGMEDLI
jgi:hypothetical protein